MLSVVCNPPQNQTIILCVCVICKQADFSKKKKVNKSMTVRLYEENSPKLYKFII